MTLPMLEAWLLPFRASIRAGEAAWFEYAKAWGFGEHGSKPLVEPSWTRVDAVTQIK